MIVQNALGYQEEIQELLHKSMLSMDADQIQAWLQYEFDPANMFCMWEDGKITSCLQIKRRILLYQGQKIAVSFISLAATLPDYRQRNHFGQLLEAALNQSAHNELMSLVYTSFPKLFEARSFVSVSKTKYYWIPSHKCIQGNEKHIRFMHENTDLYPLYLEFISHFDGSVQMTRAQFEEELNYAKACHKKIAIMEDDDKNIRGFAIYKLLNNHTKIDILVYMDANAIYDLLKYLSIRCEAISFIVSQDERFEKLFPFDLPRNQGTVLARLNNYKLFSKWIGQDIRNAKQAFSILEKPIWNHFIN